MKRTATLLMLMFASVFSAYATTTDSVLLNFDSTNGAYPVYHLTLDGSGSFFYGVATSGGANGNGLVFTYTPSTNTFVDIYDFTGGVPNSPVIEDGAGNLYGVVSSNAGYLYKLSDSGGVWSQTVLYNFAGAPSDAYRPQGELAIQSVGGGDTAIFGSSVIGGSSSNCGGGGCGAVWEYNLTTNTETMIYSFSKTDGEEANSGVTLKNVAGHTAPYPLIGTTYEGGANGLGVAYELSYISGSWTLSTLHTFAGGASDGANPTDVPILDPSTSALFGTASSGGSGSDGVVWELTSTGTYNVLHSFSGYPNDGAAPESHLVIVGSKYYGTTYLGGNADGGTVFSLSYSSGTWTYVLEYSFQGPPNDGQLPVNAISELGTGMYTMTYRGGNSAQMGSCGTYQGHACGTIVEINNP